jgi:hypothetical protein
MATRTIEVFDFDHRECWKKVEAVRNEPIALRALDAGMSALCRNSGRQWVRDLGPWRFAARNNSNWPLLAKHNPGPDSPNWYRIFGYCHAIAPWCAAIGSLLYPDHQWNVAYNYASSTEFMGEVWLGKIAKCVI